MQTKLLLFTIIIILNVIYDFSSSEKTSVCIERKNKIFLLLLIHHIFCVFLYFGWIFDNKYVLMLYIASVFVTVSHWICSGTCYLKKLTNDECDWDEHTKFNDLFNCFNMYTKTQIKIQFPILLIGSIIAFWKLT
jgi:hypothetical protein